MKTSARRAWILTILLVVTLPTTSAFAVGLIFGEIQNSDQSNPPNGSILFFGFVLGTDSEIHLQSSVGAGYDNSFWFDDFRSFVTVSAGQPYQYYFFNRDNGEGASVNSTIQLEDELVDVQLAPSTWPPPPANLSGKRNSGNSAQLSWSSRPATSWHIYRREASSDGSLFRIDNPAGDLADPGISDTTFVDASVVDGISYEYVVISEEGPGEYSPPSDVILVGLESCCSDLTGNVNQDAQGSISVSDISFIVDHLFISGAPLPCPEAANTNGSLDGVVSVGDIGVLVDFLFITQTPLAPCL